MGATSDDLMDIARAGAERIDMPDNRVRYPSFSDIEEQCATEYDELLDALHDDELFAPADVQRQEEIVQRLKELVDEAGPRADRRAGRQSRAADLAEPGSGVSSGYGRRSQARGRTKALTETSLAGRRAESRGQKTDARPLLKWAGGKRQLLPALRPFLSRDIQSVLGAVSRQRRGVLRSARARDCSPVTTPRSPTTIPI